MDDDIADQDRAGLGNPDELTSIAKIYYADDQPVVVDAAFIIEDWDWVIGFDQTETEGYDYVSVPTDRVIGVMSAEYTQFSQNGRRVTGYGIMDDEVREFRDLLPV